MPIFYFRAKDENNKLVHGKVEASTRENAAELLSERGYAIFSLRKKEFIAFLELFFQFLKRVHSQDLVVFFRQLAVMVSANLPLVRSLQVLSQQTPNKRLRAIISEISQDVEGGSRLSKSLSRYPMVFGQFIVNIIRSGETSGQLDIVLSYLADQSEKDYNTVSKVKGAMIYPILILFGLVAVGIVMLVFVIPKMVGILQEGNIALPIPTRILIGTSNFLVHYGWVLAFGIIVGLVVLRLYIRTVEGKILWDRMKVRVPIFGKLFLKIYIIRLTRSLFTLLSGGVPLTTSLKIVAEVVENELYRDLVLKTAREVDGGDSVVSVFEKSKYVPPMVSQMMSVGEQTGKLQEMLDRVANFYSMEVEREIQNLVTVIEPIIFVIMGGAVAFMMLAILLPMYSLTAGAM